MYLAKEERPLGEAPPKLWELIREGHKLVPEDRSNWSQCAIGAAVAAAEARGLDLNPLIGPVTNLSRVTGVPESTIWTVSTRHSRGWPRMWLSHWLWLYNI